MTITSSHLDSIVAGLLSVNSYRVEAAGSSFRVYVKRAS